MIKPRRLAFPAVVTAAIVAAGLLAGPALSSIRGDVTTTVRKDVKDLTPAEKKEFVDAVLKAKKTPAPGNPRVSYYDQFVLWHRDAFRCRFGWEQGRNIAGAAHNSPTFLPWHREYLMRYEQMLRDVSGNPRLALPYWDWTDPASTAAVFAPDFMGGNGDPAAAWAVTDGPFRRGQWAITIQDPAPLLVGVVKPKPFLVRNFGAFLSGPVDLPTAAEVQESLTVHPYDHAPYDGKSPIDESFRNTLEGWRDAKRAVCTQGWINQSQESWGPHVLHNAVHIYVGGLWNVGSRVAQGTMAYNTSPNDPVFFLHHANIDRIWAAWELRSSAHYKPRSGAAEGFNGTDTMWPWFDRTINSWFGTERNGYRYNRLP